MENATCFVLNPLLNLRHIFISLIWIYISVKIKKNKTQNNAYKQPIHTM